MDYPAVGDNVPFEHLDDGSAIVHELLPRHSAIIRKSAGSAFHEQLTAVNGISRLP
ncbi:MAG TPA: hypothetical protein VFN37_11840 [Candidatus Baltobacteraceae bacterium]|nr:hypothetical protein [Candidatus Baltobacteraceae bacterium]